MMPDKAFRINMMRAMIARAMMIPTRLRIRPPVARTPYSLAPKAFQIPKMLRNGATKAGTKPAPRPLARHLIPRKRDSRPRKPNVREELAAFSPACSLCTSEGCSLACYSQSSVSSALGCTLLFAW